MMMKALNALLLVCLTMLLTVGATHAAGQEMHDNHMHDDDMHDMHKSDTHDMHHDDMHGMHGSESHDEHAAAVGRPGEADKVDRTIEVVMDDTMRFTPESITVRAGETIRFEVRNTGRVPHEMVLGSKQALDAHARMMSTMPHMQHDEPNMLTLQADETGELLWQFDQEGTVDFVCLIPGHREAGMSGSITVE